MSRSARAFTLRFIVSAPATLVTAVVACSSPSDNPIQHPASSSRTSSTSSGMSTASTRSSAAYDGTVGHTCAGDADCRGPGGPGVNRCSTDAFLGGPLLPTPVCVLPSCNPGSDGNVHGCDGPDAPGAPGICYDLGGGQGVCLPACSFAADGSAPHGCTGKDACNFYGEGIDATTGKPFGLGYCLGGCTADADCAAGSRCDTTTGLCNATLSPPVLALGQACDASAPDPGCNCFGDATSGSGYCTQFCVTGSSAACPAGYVCDSTEPAATGAGVDAGLAGFATQTPGLAGSCLATCRIDSAVDASPDGLPPPEAGSDASIEEGGSGSGDATASFDATPEASAADAGVTSDGGVLDAGAAPGVCPRAIQCSAANAAGPDCLP